MALIVEDGTGKTDADSYISQADATTYIGKYTGSTTWAGATSDNKDAALRRAAQYLDLAYGDKWKGQRKTEDQSLDWPRYNVLDRDGFYVDSDSVPVAVKNAQCEMAVEILDNGEPMTKLENAGSVKKYAVRVGPISESTEYLGGNPPVTYYRKVDKILFDLIQAGANLIRG